MSATEHQATIAADGSFTAPFELAYPYDRTIGPVLSRFFRGLAERRIEGTIGSDGKVYVPPAEFDPVTGSACTEWVSVADEGVVKTWTWHGHSGWALVLLDGADIPMLHRLLAHSSDELSTGMRVVAQWADDPTASINAIDGFVAAP